MNSTGTTRFGALIALVFFILGASADGTVASFENAVIEYDPDGLIQVRSSVSADSNRFDDLSSAHESPKRANGDLHHPGKIGRGDEHSGGDAVVIAGGSRRSIRHFSDPFVLVRSTMSGNR